MLTENPTTTPGGKPLYFPKSDMTDLFVGSCLPPLFDIDERALFVSSPPRTGTVGTYVVPCDGLRAWIEANMIYGMEDCYVKLTFRADGSCLVALSYNRIIGSRWLTVLPASDVHDFFTPLED